MRLRVRQRGEDRHRHARGGRPYPHHRFRHHRRATAEQRESRLCDSSYPAPCSALCLYLLEPTRGVLISIGAATDRRHGRCLPRTQSAGEADHPRHQERGRGIPPHIRERYLPAGQTDEGSQRQGDFRHGCLHAERHLRFPARPDRTHLAREWLHHQRRGVQPCLGAPERDGAQRQQTRLRRLDGVARGRAGVCGLR